MINEKSVSLFEKSKELIPGGVNSPVRAYKSVGLTPPFITKAKGARIIDQDSNEYIDYVGSWGPMILGHANDEVIKEIKVAIDNGTSFGAPTEKEFTLAKFLCDAIPSIEMLRMVNSGTEAAMSAIRLARGYTGRDKVMKFEGCYHGHSDGLLVKAGSGALTFATPDSAGIPSDYARNTIVTDYNNCEKVSEVFKNCGNELAAVIVEPVAANMGVVLPDLEFLKLLRRLTEQYGALLIFDEVITGFRVSYSGAQGYYGITPDITILGKIIGGGMPVGAYGGRRDIMNKISPMGPVYQAGTLSGNPIAMAAGIKTLSILRDNPNIYMKLDEMSLVLEKGIFASALKYGIPVQVNRIGSLMSVFFTEEKVIDYKTAVKSDVLRFQKYFTVLLENGVYIAPSQFEAMFISIAHQEGEIEATIRCIELAFSKLKNY